MRTLRYGMIGGGRGAFIGAVHRIATAMDSEAELVAGAFSSDPKKSAASGRDLGLDPSRVYPSYEAMASAEASRGPADRLDFVVIVTPNHRHFGPAALFLKSGFNVVCEKPLAVSSAEARILWRLVRNTGKVFALTHNYSANAMIREARDLVASGRLGQVRKIVVEYTQGWLSKPNRSKQALWRTDPGQAGAGGSIGDLGTHAEHLVRYVTGLRIQRVCADLTAFVKGRPIDDDCNILVHWEKGAKGVLHCSQVSIGEENKLVLRVYGTKAGLEWHQENPNELLLRSGDAPMERLTRASAYLGRRSRNSTRVPPGHPEGYLEGFANLYRSVFQAIRAEVSGRRIPKAPDFPTVDDGLEGLLFLEAAVQSSKAGTWKSLRR